MDNGVGKRLGITISLSLSAGGGGGDMVGD